MADDAMTESGTLVYKLESTPGFNLTGGPWDGDAIFQGFRQLGRRFCETLGPRNAIFAFFYHGLGIEWGLMDASFGTAEYMRVVWELLPKCLVLRKKLDKAKIKI